MAATMKKLVVRTLADGFREAVEVQTCPIPKPSKDEALVKHRYVAINATDVRIKSGALEDGKTPPFDIGYEAIGEVIVVGEGVSSSLVGQCVANLTTGAFCEYKVVPAAQLFPIKEVAPAYLSCLVSGLTAKTALDHYGFLKPNEKVLVIAAAGGTGHYAVQFAKLSGCHVIGTCSSEEKVKFLQSIGCDHVINYAKEDLNAALQNAYPGGIDVVYETVGGKTFEICVDNLAAQGRLIKLGAVSRYKKQSGIADSLSAIDLVEKLLAKGSGIQAFAIAQHAHKWRDTYMKITELYEQKKITCGVDQGKSVTQNGFCGIEAIPDAVDYMFSRKSIGKIIVDLKTDVSQRT